jgi:signal transduction histidine kinase
MHFEITVLTASGLQAARIFAVLPSGGKQDSFRYTPGAASDGVIGRPESLASMNIARHPSAPNVRIVWLGLALAAGIFVIDCLVAVGVAIGALYAIPVLLGVWVPGRRYIWAMMLAGLALTTLGYFFSPPLPPGALVEFWQVLANRLLSMLAIVSTFFIVLHDKRSQASLQREMQEKQAAQHALVEQRALAQLGQMAAVVAHEVKNPLAGIAGAVQIIGERLPAGVPERQVVNDILKRIESLDRTVEDLLLYARPRTLDRRCVDLTGLLRETAALVSRDAHFPDLRIEIAAGEIPGCSIDPELFREVFLNLLLNAAQAMQGRGRIGVHIATDTSGCHISIADEGPGIPPELQPRIFEPFYSTRSRGTGLGLSIARRVVEEHGGVITITCPPEGGTTARIFLPRAVVQQLDTSGIIPGS